MSSIDQTIEQNIREILRQLGLVSKEEALAQAVQHLSNEEKIKMFSDVGSGEVSQISLFFTLAERYAIEWLKNYAENELQIRVSVNRMGRREFVLMVSPPAGPTPTKAGFRGRIASVFKRRGEVVSEI